MIFKQVVLISFVNNVSRQLTVESLIFFDRTFYFLITYGVCKKRKYCNRMSEKKKNSLLLTNVYF